MKKEATFLIGSLGGGGAEGVCINIANGLADQGWQINLLVLNLNNAPYINRVSDKVNLISLNINHARHSFNSIKKYIKLEKPEKIIVFTYDLSVVLVMVRMATRGKFKIIARNNSTLSKNSEMIEGYLRRKAIQYLISVFYGKVDHVINQCNEMERDLLSIFPNLIGKTSVIYNPVNKLIESIASEIDFSSIEKGDFFLCVGRLEPVKAFNYAIEAFSIFIKKNPDTETRLKIVGQGSLDNELKKSAQKLGIATRVDFEGFKTDVIPYYIKARATLLTSLYEGFPNVLIESITLGTPVIAFDCPNGPSEIIKECKNGYLIRYQDVAHLANAMDKVAILNAEQTRETAKVFSFDKNIKKYYDIIESL